MFVSKLLEIIFIIWKKIYMRNGHNILNSYDIIFNLLFWDIHLLSDMNKILNNEQIDNWMTIKSKSIMQRNSLFPKKLKWIMLYEFVTSFIILQWKDSYDLIGDRKVKLSGSPKTFLCIKTSEKNDN